MPDAKGGDLLMKFVQSNGDIVKADATSTLTKDDRLLFDFWPGKFFEVQEFQLGVNIEDSQTGSNVLNAATTQQQGSAASGGRGAKFAAWRDFQKKTSSDVADIVYPVVLEPFSFTKAMDRSSPIFFQSCCNSISFGSAALVKRKVTGTSMALQTFLRIDFTDVLIIGLDWDDADPIKEKFKVICRGMTVQYKQQASDGSLGAARSADWARDMATRTAT